MNGGWLEMMSGKSALVGALAIIATTTTYTNYAISNHTPYLAAEKAITQSIVNNKEEIVDIKRLHSKTVDALFAIRALLEKHDAEIDHLKKFQDAQIKEQLRRSDMTKLKRQ